MSGHDDRVELPRGDVGRADVDVEAHEAANGRAGYRARRRSGSTRSSRLLAAIAVVIVVAALVPIGQLLAARSVRAGLERTDDRRVRSLLRAEECVHADVRSWYTKLMFLDQPSTDPIAEEIRRALRSFFEAPQWSIESRDERSARPPGSKRPPLAVFSDRATYDHGVLRIDEDELDRAEHSTAIFTTDHSLYQPAGASFWITSCIQSYPSPLVLAGTACFVRSVEGDEVVLKALYAPKRVEADCAGARASRVGVVGETELRIRSGVMASQRFEAFGGRTGARTVTFERSTGEIDVPPFWRIVPDWARRMVA